MSRVAFITGVTGQDGSYLAEYLLSIGCEVHGMIRRSSSRNTSRVDHILRETRSGKPQFHLHYGDLTDAAGLATLIESIQPDEVYNLAAQSHVKVSFDLPNYTAQVTGVGVANVLEAIRKSDVDTKFYQASSSEMFGGSSPPQSEETRFYPRSPYAVAKVYAYWITVNYREAYGIHACNGILFNHESPRRGEKFVTRKITKALASIVAGRQEKLVLGNLQARRDWGFAPEYVVGMTRILEHNRADDFVIGTGVSHSIEDFLSFSFGYLNMDWRDYVETDSKYMRPSEVHELRADTTKAGEALGWDPKIGCQSLAQIMVDYDLKRLGLEHPGRGIEEMISVGLGWIREPEVPT